MGIFEAIALLVLIIAILILAYYFIKNSPEANKYFNEYITSPVKEKNIYQSFEGIKRNSESGTVGEKLKVKIKDMEMPNINTDAFSKKLEHFLNERSEDLINEWNLATNKDIKTLENRFDNVKININGLEKRFNEYREYTNEKIDSLDERLKKLEEDK
ncbi:hypothetical protein [Methanobrevibacter curvatus]|uniref:Chromosome partition protein Smc n=1 Tax=Methanobrevibacter curvatus TaxID=49547 RepID=A0A162FNV7_9EURY|nr:hypothetical protein [Methanobrevibacter curvatus]KZX12870.1 hypothetical protein MBCUR_08300 [Methanobrevibacter curvatus]